MPEFTIPLMLTLDAGSYQHAMKMADEIAEGIGADGLNIYACDTIETDNDGQRVYYLPPENVSNENA